MAVHELDIFVLVDAEGNYVVAKDHDNLAEVWDDDIGGIPLGSRVLKARLSVEMAPPTELTAYVPAAAGEVTMGVKGQPQ